MASGRKLSHGSSPRSPTSPPQPQTHADTAVSQLFSDVDVPEPTPYEDLEGYDSGIDAASSNFSDSESLSTWVFRYREENGRRYHAYGSTEHWGPNDESAQYQQDISHHLWNLTLDNRLYLAPIERPQTVLDLGTGTGIWAIDMGDAHPQAEVKGIDLSPIQPMSVPPNVRFEVDDYNLDWLDHDRFDLIHARELLGSVPDWPALYRKIFDALRPGGWLDQAEPSIFLISDHVDLGPDHVFVQWGRLMVEASERANLPFDIVRRMKSGMEEAGFINVTEIRVPWPIGRWPQDERQQEIGRVNRIRIERGILDFCSRRFSNNLGWSAEELEVFGAKMRAAVADSRLRAHQWVYFVFGQKPEATQ